MSADIRHKHQHLNESNVEPSHGQKPSRPPLLTRIGGAFRQIKWGETLLIALVMSIGWCVLFFMNSWLQYLVGILPVSAGLYLGRRVKQQVPLHGLILGITGFLFGMSIMAFHGILSSVGVVPPITMSLDASQQPVTFTPPELILFYIQFSLFAMIPFPVLGTVIANRNEQRRAEAEGITAARGGQLERPDTVRTLEDLQGLSLPKFGTYVANIFKHQGFKLKDYRFEKDRYLDLDMEYNDEPYLVRLSVADKVRHGTIETLAQDMRHRNIKKGLVITSTEFAPEAIKAAKGRRNMVLIDGQTLFDIA